MEYPEEAIQRLTSFAEGGPFSTLYGIQQCAAELLAYVEHLRTAKPAAESKPTHKHVYVIRWDAISDGTIPYVLAVILADGRAETASYGILRPQEWARTPDGAFHAAEQLRLEEIGRIAVMQFTVEQI